MVTAVLKYWHFDLRFIVLYIFEYLYLIWFVNSNPEFIKKAFHLMEGCLNMDEAMFCLSPG